MGLEKSSFIVEKSRPLQRKTSTESGPYEIHRLISPVIVDFRRKGGRWLRHVHIQDLKLTDNNDNNTEDVEGEDDEKADN